MLNLVEVDRNCFTRELGTFSLVVHFHCCLSWFIMFIGFHVYSIDYVPCTSLAQYPSSSFYNWSELRLEMILAVETNRENSSQEIHEVTRHGYTVGYSIDCQLSPLHHRDSTGGSRASREGRWRQHGVPRDLPARVPSELGARHRCSARKRQPAKASITSLDAKNWPPVPSVGR